MGGIVTQSTSGQPIELSGFYVSLELAVPCVGVKLGKPFPELLELVAREFPDISFDLLYFIQAPHPQGLKPEILFDLFGTAEAVP